MAGDLQQIYQQVCDEELERYGYFRTTGYQARAAKEVGRRIGRILIEEDWMYTRLTRYWPFGAAEGRLAASRLSSLTPAITGNTKTFYLLRDALKAIRGIDRHARCATCRTRRKVEYQDDGGWHEWIIPSRSNLSVYAPTCSYNCYRKAQKKLNQEQKQRDKETKWLKIARQRQTEVRKYLRNTRAA